MADYSRFSSFVATLKDLHRAESTDEKCNLLVDLLGRLARTADDPDLVLAWYNLLLLGAPTKITAKQLDHLVGLVLKRRPVATAGDVAALAAAIDDSSEFALLDSADPAVLTVYRLLAHKFATRTDRVASLRELVSLCSRKALRYVFAVMLDRVRPLVGGAAVTRRVIKKCADQPALETLLLSGTVLPLRPMLARPLRALSAIADWSHHMVQIKYDGERLLVVKNGGGGGDGAIRFYARSLKEVRPKKVQGLERVMRDCVTADTFVLDGELLPAGRHRQHPAFVAFDCTHCDEGDLRHRPLVERAAALARIVRPDDEGRLRLARSLDGVNADTIVDLVDRLLVTRRHEGLVVKALHEPYVSNAKRWWKIKVEYLAGYADTLDLAVVGADRGTAAADGFASYYLAAKDTADGGDGEFSYRVVAKVASRRGDGLADTVEWVESSCVDHPVGFGAYGGGGGAAAEFVVVKLAEAPVLEVRFASVTDRLCLRYPVVVRVRDDKTVDDIDTLETVEKHWQAQKLIDVVDDDDDLPPAKRVKFDQQTGGEPLAGVEQTGTEPLAGVAHSPTRQDSSSESTDL